MDLQSCPFLSKFLSTHLYQSKETKSTDLYFILSYCSISGIYFDVFFIIFQEQEKQNWEAVCQALRSKLEASESACLRSEIEAAKMRSTYVWLWVISEII